MKLSLLLFTLTLSTSLFAQETVRRVDKSDRQREEYYVLKSDKSIRQGPYAAYSLYSKLPYCEGSYTNNLKDSLWRYYSFNHKICTAGYYKDGKRVGTWVAYDVKGDREVEYDYSTNQLLFYQKSEKKPDQVIISGQDTLKTDPDRPALYIDGTGNLSRIIGTSMRYPLKAKENNIQGKVLIAFTVDTLGKVSNYRVKHGIGGGCDEEALRAVKLMDGDWLPAMLAGKPVTVECTMPLSFTLENR